MVGPSIIPWSSGAEEHRVIPEPVYKAAPVVPKRVEKVRFIPRKEIIPFIILNDKNLYIQEQILKRIRAGDLADLPYGLLVMSLIIVIFGAMDSADAFLLFQHLGKLNAPQLGKNQPGYFDTPICSNTEIYQTILGSGENIPPTEWPWQWEGIICSQTESFRKEDGSVDIEQGYQEPWEDRHQPLVHA